MTTQPPSDDVEVARAAFVAGLLHSTVRASGWTILESDPAAGRFTVGLASLFGPGIAADLTVTLRQLEPTP